MLSRQPVKAPLPHLAVSGCARLLVPFILFDDGGSTRRIVFIITSCLSYSTNSLEAISIMNCPTLRELLLTPLLHLSWGNHLRRYLGHNLESFVTKFPFDTTPHGVFTVKLINFSP